MKNDPKTLLKQARKSMGATQNQQALLKRAKKQLGFSNKELGAALGGKSADTIKSWLAPENAAKHRNMPEGTKMLLAHILQAKSK